MRPRLRQLPLLRTNNRDAPAQRPLTQWAERVKEHGWSEVYVYFKHDEGVGSGPPAVNAFLDILDRQ